MTKDERQEIAYILGLITGLLNTLPASQENLDKLIDAVSKFTLKGIDNPS